MEGLLFFHSSLSVSPWTTYGRLGKTLEDTLENILCISALEVLHLALGVQQTGRNHENRNGTYSISVPFRLAYTHQKKKDHKSDEEQEGSEGMV